MKREDIKTREIMINRNGKPLFAVVTADIKDNNINYVFIENGDIKFSSSWYDSIVAYELSNESHRLAKDIFTIGLQAAVKTKIYELKQLESILKDLHLEECLGNVMVDNTKLLLDMSKEFEVKTKQIIESTEAKVQEVIEVSKETVQKVVDTSKAEIKSVVEDAIVDTVAPIAIQKSKKGVNRKDANKITE